MRRLSFWAVNWVKKAAKLCHNPSSNSAASAGSISKEAALNVEIGERTGASVPPGMRIYAIGDIHGRRDLLDELVPVHLTMRSLSGQAGNHSVYKEIRKSRLNKNRRIRPLPLQAFRITLAGIKDDTRAPLFKQVCDRKNGAVAKHHIQDSATQPLYLRYKFERPLNT